MKENMKFEFKKGEITDVTINIADEVFDLVWIDDGEPFIDMWNIRNSLVCLIAFLDYHEVKEVNISLVDDGEKYEGIYGGRYGYKYEVVFKNGFKYDDYETCYGATL